MINQFKIKNGLNTEFIGQTVVFEEVTLSTNTLAKENSHLPEGTVFVANSQTAGRGRLGREWASQPDAGIYMSILLKPNIAIKEMPKITLLAGIAGCRVIENSKIKYPNDIVIGTKKVSGILCEMSQGSDGKTFVVCGIGINVNTKAFDGELSQKATSLLVETGRLHSRVEIIQKFLTEFEKLYTEFLQSGIAPMMSEYKEKCVNIGSDVRAICENREIIGKCVDITLDGAIVVQTKTELVEINTGDISVRGIYGYV